ncbi:hypothetical protein O181_100139 [Austropuccinia psidii MF-1]|uniref:Uncharacterized protein n=1 Tax=Austropuccinia psidii MF-1 TaxID=1389203 RepID=A0A9Q3JEM1_9BASI|nr:hypothetical protein [Austropuccinia psidii MF-1]
MENGRQGIQPRAPLERTCRKSGNPANLPCGFTPLRQQKIGDQESPYFQIPGRIQERKKIIGQEQNFFQAEAERVRSHDPELFRASKRSKMKQHTVVNTSNEASSPKIRNDISTNIGHIVVIHESNINSNTLWLQSS